MTHNHEHQDAHAQGYEHEHHHAHAHQHSHDHHHGKKQTCGHHHHGSFKKNISFYLAGILVFALAFLVPNALIQTLLFILATLLSGHHVIWEGIEDTLQASKAKHRFMPNAHLLMTLAAIGTVLLGEASESALLIFIFAGAHFLEDYVESKNQSAMSALLALKPHQAQRLLPDGRLETVDAKDLAIGDTIQVLNGSQIPADGLIIKGQSAIDESAISGESIPVEKGVGDKVYAATLNQAETLFIQVTQDASNSLFAKIIQLVQEAQETLSPSASFIKRAEPIYINVVLSIFLALLILLPSLFAFSLSQAFTLSLTFLVSASPCALAVAVVPATLAGMTRLAKDGVLVKGGAYLSALSDIKVIAFDKTGTLTNGQPAVTDYAFDNPQTQAMVAAMEGQSNHPLAFAIASAFAESLSNSPIDLKDLDVVNSIGQGVSASYKGVAYRIAKPSSFKNVEASYLQKQAELEAGGKTVVFVSKNENVVGYIALLDKPKSRARETLAYLESQGIQTVMVTGDAEATAQAIGADLGLHQVIAGVLPTDKASVIEDLKANFKQVAMVGDGINDAPALAKATLGIAMGEGSDIALESADLILMKNDLSKLKEAHKVSQKLKRNIYQNTGFALLVVLLLVLATFLVHLPILASVTLHEGSTLLVLLNSIRLLKKVK